MCLPGVLLSGSMGGYIQLPLWFRGSGTLLAVRGALSRVGLWQVGQRSKSHELRHASSSQSMSKLEKLHNSLPEWTAQKHTKLSFYNYHEVFPNKA